MSRMPALYMSVISTNLSAFTVPVAGGLREHPLFEVGMLRVRGVSNLPVTQSWMLHRVEPCIFQLDSIPT